MHLYTYKQTEPRLQTEKSAVILEQSKCQITVHTHTVILKLESSSFDLFSNTTHLF